jgi:hypothetical protein
LREDQGQAVAFPSRVIAFLEIRCWDHAFLEGGLAIGKGGDWVRRLQGWFGVAQCAVVLAGSTLVMWRKRPTIEDGLAVWFCFSECWQRREKLSGS